MARISEEISKDRVCRHIGVIMDGDREHQTMKDNCILYAELILVLDMSGCLLTLFLPIAARAKKQWCDL